MAAPTDMQLAASVVRVATCVFLDLVDDPLHYGRAMVGPLAMPATTILPAADPRFDGQTFHTLSPELVSISPIQQAEGGTGDVMLTVSGTLELDAETLNALNDRSRFQDRDLAIWDVLLDEDYQPVAASSAYQGYMVSVEVSAEPPDEDGHARQTISVTAKNYLTLLTGRAGKTLLWSPDPGDKAAEATLGSKGAASALGDPYSTVQMNDGWGGPW